MSDSIVIGIIYHAGTFTAATRRGRAFGAIQQHANVTDGEVLAKVFDLANVHRHEAPTMHLAGDDVLRIVDSIRKARIACALFNWFAQVNNTQCFANLGSMQFNELRDQINTGLRTGFADDVLTSELEAFEDVGTGWQIEFMRPGKVADALGHYPAKALAILLANQYSAAPATQFRPLAGGYVPVQSRVVGHDPFASQT